MCRRSWLLRRQPLLINTFLLLLQLADSVTLSITQLLRLSLLVNVVSRQSFIVELGVDSVLVLREDFEPLGAWSRLFLQLKLGFEALGLLRFSDLVKLGLAFSKQLVLVGELPDRWLVLLLVLNLDAEVWQYIVSDFVASVEHRFRAILRFDLDLVSKVG